MMVVLAGGELFTGNTAYLTVALAEGKATPMQVCSAPRRWPHRQLPPLFLQGHVNHVQCHI